MRYSRQEQETTVIWNEAEKVANIYAASPVSMRKLNRLCEEFPEVYRRTWTEGTGGNITAAKYEVDSRFIRFGKPASEARIASGRRLAGLKMNSTPKTAP